MIIFKDIVDTDWVDVAGRDAVWRAGSSATEAGLFHVGFEPGGEGIGKVNNFARFVDETDGEDVFFALVVFVEFHVGQGIVSAD